MFFERGVREDGTRPAGSPVLKLAIIGAGPSGLVTAIALMKRLHRPFEAWLVDAEDAPGAFANGAAGNAPTTEPARDLSVVPERPDDFADWLKAGWLAGGTIATLRRPQDLHAPRSLFRDYVMALTAHGFRRFLFVNGHGGNIPTLQSAWYEIHEELNRTGHPDAGEVRFAVQNWWSGAQVKAYADEAFGAAEGSHATCTEISLMQFLYPDHAPVLAAPLDPAVAPHHAFHGPAHYRAVHPDGRIGSDPSLASPDHGGRLLDIAVMEAMAAYEKLTATP